MSNKLLAVNAGWNLISHLMTRGVLMVAAIYLSRHFDVQEFASYSYFNLTVSMLTAFSSLGLGVGASKYFAALNIINSSENYQKASGLWVVSFIISIIVALIIAMMPIEVVGAGLNLPIWLYSIGVFLTFQAIVPSGAMLGLEKYRSAVAVAIVYSFVIITSSYISVYYGSILIAVFGVLLAISIQAILETLIVLRYIGFQKFKLNVNFRIEIVRELISFSFPMIFVSLIAASGTWILGRFIMMADNGVYNFAIYTIGLQWYALGLLLPGVISKVMLPKLIKDNILSDKLHGTRRIVKNGIYLSIGASVVIAILGAIVGPLLVKLYGAQYSPDRWYIAAYLIAAIFNSPANAIGNALIANNKQNKWGFLLFLWLLVLIIMGNLSFGNGAYTGAIALTVAAFALSSASFLVANRDSLV